MSTGINGGIRQLVERGFRIYEDSVPLRNWDLPVFDLAGFHSSDDIGSTAFILVHHTARMA